MYELEIFRFKLKYIFFISLLFPIEVEQLVVIIIVYRSHGHICICHLLLEDTISCTAVAPKDRMEISLGFNLYNKTVIGSYTNERI